MKWGGEVDGTYLSNTCTIDNGLTIMHLFYQQHEHFQHLLDLHDTRVGKVLNSVMMMMTEGEFAAAKAMWAGLGETDCVPNRVRNLFGDERDYMFRYLEEDWESQTISACSSEECSEPMVSGNIEHGCVGIGCENSIKSAQELIDWWLKRSTPCQRTVLDENGETVSKTNCDGCRAVTRRVLKTAPFLPVRVYEHCMFGRMNIEDILQGKTVHVLNEKYTIAGITMHKHTHYCAVIHYKQQYLWYDGLKSLSPMKKNLGQWFPSYIIFGKVV